MSRTRIPVLAYHGVHPERSLITITPAVFERQMSWLADAGYQTLSFNEFVSFLHDGKPVPARSIVLTFDDGFEGLYQYAFPIFKEYGFRATIFLVSGYCGADNDWPGQPAGIPRLSLLNWDQIGEMDSYGIEFGSHTVTHPRLDQLSLSEVEHEILGSKVIIERYVAHKVSTFAFPYGRYNERVRAVVKAAFMGACCSRVGFAGPMSDPYDVERIDVNYVQHPALFSILGNPMSQAYFGLRRKLREFGGIVFRREWQ